MVPVAWPGAEDLSAVCSSQDGLFTAGRTGGATGNSPAGLDSAGIAPAGHFKARNTKFCCKNSTEQGDGEHMWVLHAVGRKEAAVSTCYPGLTMRPRRGTQIAGLDQNRCSDSGESEPRDIQANQVGMAHSWLGQTSTSSVTQLLFTLVTGALVAPGTSQLQAQL